MNYTKAQIKELEKKLIENVMTLGERNRIRETIKLFLQPKTKNNSLGRRLSLLA